MKYGYARVSTRKQSRDGNGLEAQIQELEKVGCEKILTEQFTGNAAKRPVIEKLLAEIQKDDILAVTKLDRLARSMNEGVKVIEDLFRRGVAIHILNLGVLDDTPVGRLIIHIFLAIAEFERAMIIERANAGLEVARSKEGFRLGRKPLDADKKRNAADLIILQHMTYAKVEGLTGFSRSTIKRAVKARRDELALQQETMLS